MLGLCFVLKYFVSFLVLQSSRWVKERWLLYFCCALNVMSLILFIDSSSRYHCLVCSMKLWYFLVRQEANHFASQFCGIHSTNPIFKGIDCSNAFMKLGNNQVAKFKNTLEC